MSHLPTITDQDLRDRFGPRSYRQGRDYFEGGAVSGTWRDGAVLSGRVQGSRSSPYRVQVVLGGDGIAEAECSCPVGSFGHCKHVAALLLAWLDDPAAFREVADLDAWLGQRSQAELIALIKRMLHRVPELEELLDVPVVASGQPFTEADREAIRRQAAEAFRRAGYAWGAESNIPEGLTSLLEVSDGYAKVGDPHGAALVAATVLEALAERVTQYGDEEGDLRDVAAGCVERLRASLGLLPHEGARETRDAILRALFEAVRADLEGGGIGFVEEAADVLLEATSPEERATIAAWARDAMESGPRDAFDDWAREAWGGLLLDLELDTLDDEAFIQVCRETGRSHALVDRLLQLGRVDEALAEVRVTADFDFLDLANVLVDRGQVDAAETIVAERLAGGTAYPHLLEWQKTQALARGDHERALDLTCRLFQAAPTLEGYREARELASALERWQDLRPDLIARVQSGTHRGLLADIYLDEGDIDRALEAVHGTSLFEWGYGDAPRPLRVARAAEATRPRAALEIFQRYVDAYIDQRNRASYQEAAALLVRMRDIRLGLGEANAWDAYIADLRERYPRLRALREELNAAGL